MAKGVCSKQTNNRQVHEPPRPFIRRRQVPPLPQLPSRKIVENNNQLSAPPRPVILKRLPPLAQNPVFIVQRIQHLGITQVDPQAYLARYGSSLLDSSTLVQQARSIGIIADISLPTTVSNPKSKNFIDIFIPS